MNKMKILIGIMIVGILLLSGLSASQISTSQVRVNSDNSSQPVPFVVKYSFSVGGTGHVSYYNNLIFISNTTQKKVWVYNTHGLQIALLNVIAQKITKLTNSQVVLWNINASVYYIYNTTDYILSAQYTVPKIIQNNLKFFWTDLAPVYEHYYGLPPLRINVVAFNNSNLVFPLVKWGNQIIAQIVTEPNGDFWYAYREAYPIITGFGIWNPLHGFVSNLTFASEAIPPLYTWYVAQRNPGYTSTISTNFIPSSVVVFHTFMMNSQGTLSFFVKTVTGVKVSTHSILFNSSGSRIVQFDFTNNSVTSTNITKIVGATPLFNQWYNTSPPILNGGTNNLVTAYKALQIGSHPNFAMKNALGCEGYIISQYNPYFLYFTKAKSGYMMHVMSLERQTLWFSDFVVIKNIVYSRESFTTHYNIHLHPDAWVYNITIFSAHNTLNEIFSTSILNSNTFSMSRMGSNILLESPLTNSLYIFAFKPTVPLNVHLQGAPLNSGWNVAIVPYGMPKLAATIINNTVGLTAFTVYLFPIEYQLVVNSPDGYVVSWIHASGLQLNLSKYQFRKQVDAFINITSDPTLNITFVPTAYPVSFNSNLNLGNAWLSQFNLQNNVQWQLKIEHGTDPAQHTFFANSLAVNDVNVTNYTLIQNSTSTNMLFYLQNGTYSYAASIMPEFLPLSSSFIVIENTTETLVFSPNYPQMGIAPIPTIIPTQTAWVFESESTAGPNTSISQLVWHITGPMNYYGTGTKFIAYFNVTGSYTIQLTAVNNYGLQNNTTASFSVHTPYKASMHFVISPRVGYWTNTSATYVVQITATKQISQLVVSIDGKSYMNVQYVSSTNQSGNWTFEYFATFAPDKYGVANHTLIFTAYTNDGGYNSTTVYKLFGNNINHGFNLISLFGGLANFWIVVVSLLGVIVTVAGLKISRTSNIIIESQGKVGVIKVHNMKKLKKQKKKGGPKL